MMSELDIEPLKSKSNKVLRYREFPSDDPSYKA